MLSRGLRNKNPGNIRLSTSRFQGEISPSRDSEFKQFVDMKWGYRAMFLIIHNYRELYGIDTLDRIIGRWAPSCENDTKHYTEVVARRLGCATTAHINSLDRDTMIDLVSTMSRIECGEVASIEQVEAGWRLFCQR